eukprot:TRINITY_DN1468_c0_g1_i1.p1 TRINITY_DN1468_c0_g1~~TRINITY_DN1468_c0_g1_i1.p1  ORF type:complete len:268 (+),score=40.83 TRINITY_DN1468_c0_g1_i1:106-909(+)
MYNMKKFLEKYVILEIFSNQKWAEVLFVFNKETKDVEVLKILKNKTSEEYNRDVEIIKSLSHSNILSTTIEAQDLITEENNCKILTYKKCDNDLFNYCEKMDFDLERDEVRSIIKQMALAVEYLHHKEMAHCDIKLENFLVDQNEDNGSVDVYLIDFENLIRLDDEQSNYTQGTAIYCPPETFSLPISSIDPKAVDIFSLGICFHTILCGFLPYEQNEDNEEIANSKILIIEDLSILERDLIKKMLCKKPSKRLTISEVLSHPLLNQ